MSVLSAASTASHLLPPAEWLREKALEYCQRLLEQSGRRESWACPACLRVCAGSPRCGLPGRSSPVDAGGTRRPGGPLPSPRSPEEGRLGPAEGSECRRAASGWWGAHAPSEPPVSPQCLVEAVLVLDVLCRQDPAFLYRVLPCLRALRTRLCGDPACARALLPVARFFLRHGEHLPRWRTGRPGSPHSPLRRRRAAVL